MNYDYVILLCADKKNPDGEFPEFRNGDYIGGQNRMRVALEYSLLNPKTVFVVTGGFNRGEHVSQKVYDMVSYLKEGNPKIKIVSVPSLPCVRHNFVAILNQMQRELKGKKIAILTSYLFVPRTLAIWSKLVEEEYRDMPVLHVICSESFIDNQSVIDKNIELYMKRIEREKQGLHDLEEGKYVDFCLEKEKDGFMELAKKYLYLTSKKEKEKYGLFEKALEVSK